jgi:hypothetical protein
MLQHQDKCLLKQEQLSPFGKVTLSNATLHTSAVALLQKNERVLNMLTDLCGLRRGHQPLGRSSCNITPIKRSNVQCRTRHGCNDTAVKVPQPTRQRQARPLLASFCGRTLGIECAGMHTNTFPQR